MSIRHNVSYEQKDFVLIAIRSYIAILLAIMAFCYTAKGNAEESVQTKDPLASHIEKHCKRDCVDASLLRVAATEATKDNHVDPLLLLAVIQTESGFKHRALNTHNGRSVGLTQVQVRWHRARFKTKDYFDVFENVRAGSDILSECQKKYHGNTSKALWCYNGHQANGVSKYSKKVLAVYAVLKENLIKL